MPSAASFLNVRVDSLEFAVYITTQDGLPLMIQNILSILTFIHDNALVMAGRSLRNVIDHVLEDGEIHQLI